MRDYRARKAAGAPLLRAPAKKLSPEVLEEARRMRAAGATYRAIAAEFDVDFSYLARRLRADK